MASSNKHLHITLDERRIIEIGIRNNSTKTAIARTLGRVAFTFSLQCNHFTRSNSHFLLTNSLSCINIKMYFFIEQPISRNNYVQKAASLCTKKVRRGV